MPYWITLSYLPSGSSDFPAFTPAESDTRFSDPDGRKAELTWVLATSQDSLPTRDGLIINNR